MLAIAYQTPLIAQPIKLPNKIIDIYVKRNIDSINKFGITIDRIKSNITSHYVDIYNDKKMDWVIYYESLNCGSSGCTGEIYIFDPKTKKWFYEGKIYQNELRELLD